MTTKKPAAKKVAAKSSPAQPKSPDDGWVVRWTGFADGKDFVQPLSEARAQREQMHELDKKLLRMKLANTHAAVSSGRTKGGANRGKANQQRDAEIARAMKSGDHNTASKLAAKHKISATRIREIARGEPKKRK